MRFLQIINIFFPLPEGCKPRTPSPLALGANGDGMYLRIFVPKIDVKKCPQLVYQRAGGKCDFAGLPELLTRVDFKFS